MLQRLSLFGVMIFFISSLILTYHLMPLNGYDFLDHPQSASWLFTLIITFIPVMCLSMMQWIKSSSQIPLTEEALPLKKLNGKALRKELGDKYLFIANISHEIRNPLQAILGTHELLLKDPQLKKDNKKLIQNAHQTTRSLLNILNRVLDLSKIDSDQSFLHLEPINLELLLRHTVHSQRPLIQTKDVELHVCIDQNLAPSLLIDSVRLQQVFVNLISNAIKFTEKGSIFVSIHVLSDSHKDQSLQIQVIDTGFGIAKENVERIMRPYEQCRNHENSSIPGSGLGLAITKELLESMNSTLHIESTPQLGTCVSFRIQPKRSSLPPKNLPEKLKLPNNPLVVSKLIGKRVLIVDDYPACQEIIQHHCKHLGFETFLASNAKTAIEILEQSSIDVVITDELMPDMPGSELSRIALQIQPAISVIILTGDQLFQERFIETHLPCHAFLIKPVSIGDLYNTLKLVSSESDVAWSFESLVHFTNHDNLSAREILQSILDTQRSIYKELLCVFQQHEWAKVPHLCHKLVSGSHLIKAQLLTDFCNKSNQADFQLNDQYILQVLQILNQLNKQLHIFLNPVK
jgi:two-component system sensor histidine kinase EvgS